MEGENDEEAESGPTLLMNTIGIPNEEKLVVAYNVYRTSKETVRLLSEKGRVVYPEIFMENIKLGPLHDLCVRAIGQAFASQPLPLVVLGDPLNMRMFYDSLNVDLALDHCNYIDDVEYWKRVVKSKSKQHATVKECAWKSLGLSMKYVDLVEDCAAEYWPTEEMQRLALLIKDFVNEMHIRKLKPLQERSFAQFIESEAESDSAEESTASVTTTTSEETPYEATDATPDDQKTDEELEWEQREAEQLAIEKKELHEDREARRKELAARRARNEARRLREELRNAPTPPPTKKKKKKIKLKNLNVFELSISEDEDDGEDDIIDKRNMAKLLHRHKKYKYPPEDCHHIDMSFVQWFENLNTLTIEFQSPDMEREYDDKNFNFSYKDMENLARGISLLSKLKTFRLRNSRMNAKKLETLVGGLIYAEELETVDFGNDQLKDDCGNAILKLFRNVTAIKSLQLEGNEIGPEVLKALGSALSHYEGTLEYLSLAANPVGEKGLHALAAAIIGTEHVKHLCLTGISVSQEGIMCCIANELLREHKIMKRMDLVAINIGWTAGTEVLKALMTNQTILEMDCRGCNLDPDMEYEIEVLLKRNRYVLENTYLNDDSKTEEEILAFVDRIRNPILLDALAKVEKRIACLEIQPVDPLRYSKVSLVLEIEEEKEESLNSLERFIRDVNKKSDAILRGKLSADSIVKEETTVEEEPPFVYDTNLFTEEQYLEHVFTFGTPDRYAWVQTKKHRAMFDWNE